MSDQTNNITLPTRQMFLLAGILAVGGPVGSGVGAAVGSTADSSALAALTQQVSELNTQTSTSQATVSARLEAMSNRVGALESQMVNRTQDRYTRSEAESDKRHLSHRIDVLEDEISDLRGKRKRNR